MFVLAGVFLVIVLVMVGPFVFFFRLWIQAMLARADATLLDLLGMTLRRVPSKVADKVIAQSKVMAMQAALADEPGMTTSALEADYLAGSNVPKVICAFDCREQDCREQGGH